MRALVVLLICGAFTIVSPAQQVVSLDLLPPSVIKTEPASGEANVDAGTTKQISVTFSKDMQDGSWSWSRLSDETFPKIIGSPRYLPDKRTCVVNVELEPNKTYVIWLNTQEFGNFKDTRKQSAIPYLLVFKTK